MRTRRRQRILRSSNRDERVINIPFKRVSTFPLRSCVPFGSASEETKEDGDGVEFRDDATSSTKRVFYI